MGGREGTPDCHTRLTRHPWIAAFKARERVYCRWYTHVHSMYKIRTCTGIWIGHTMYRIFLPLLGNLCVPVICQWHWLHGALQTLSVVNEPHVYSVCACSYRQFHLTAMAQCKSLSSRQSRHWMSWEINWLHTRLATSAWMMRYVSANV